MAAWSDSHMFGSEMDDEEIKVDAFVQLSLRKRADVIDIYSKPRCLVYTDDEGFLALKADVLSAISQIEGPLNVVGVCGIYRTGKSYLMNRLAGATKGFSLGDTIQSETKGIWIWCKSHPKYENETLLLIDTEGLADPEKGDQDHDNKLFCLTLLLSSTMILNVKGVLDYDTFDKLAFITKLTSNIHILRDNDDQQFNAINIKLASPHLIMCVRDFHLQSIRNNKKLTPDEYLEDSLKPSDKKKQEKYNEIKTCIKNFFPKRKCFTIAQPALGEKLQQIECQPDDQLEKKFIENIEDVKNCVYDCEPKYFCSTNKKTVDGADFSSLVTSYVTALRKGSSICLQEAYVCAAERRNKKVLQTVMDEFQNDLYKTELPKSKRSLQTKFLIAYDQGLAKYRNESVPYQQEEFEEEAMTEMQRHFEILTKKLTEKSQEEGKRKLTELYREMMSKHKSEYNAQDGYDRYKSDMVQLEKDYFSQMKGYDEDDLYSALQSFKGSKQSSQMTSYNAATQSEDLKQFVKFNDELRMAMIERMEKAHTAESERRDKYMAMQMDALRTEFQLLYDKLLQRKEKKSCIVM